MDYVAGDCCGNPVSVPVSGFSALRIVPELFGNSIDFRKVKTEIEISGFKSKLPFLLPVSSPVVVSSDFEKFSSGALSAGIPIVIGEHSLSFAGAKSLKEKLKQYSVNSKKFGAIILRANISELHSKSLEKATDIGVNCIELSFGSGSCKAFSTANSVEAEKLEKAEFAVIKENGFFNCFPLPPAISEEEIRVKLLKCSESGLPLMARLRVGCGIIKLLQLFQKIKRENDIPLHGITIEGSCGLPSSVLFSSLEEKPSFDLIVAEDLSSGHDIVKAMMLGAKAVELPEKAFFSAVQNSAVGKKNGIEVFSKQLEREIQFCCASLRVDSVSELYRKKKNLFALSKETADLFGVSSNPKTLL